MGLGKRILVMVGLLAGVQAIILVKMTEALGWTTKDQLAPLQAVCFLGLMLGAIIGIGPEVNSRKLTMAGIIIFAVEILSNVLVSYDYGLGHLNVQAVLGYFPFLNEEEAQRHAATVFGASLSLVALLCWLHVAEMLKVYQASKQHEERAQRSSFERLSRLIDDDVEVTGPIRNSW